MPGLTRRAKSGKLLDPFDVLKNGDQNQCLVLKWYFAESSLFFIKPVELVPARTEAKTKS